VNMKKSTDQYTYERARRLHEKILKLTRNARDSEDDDRIEKEKDKLFNLVKDYTEDAHTLLHLPFHPDLLERLDAYKTSTSHNSIIDGKQLKKENQVFPFPDAKWEDFIIFGLNEGKVKIKNLKNNKEDIFSYVELDMVDKRTKKPNRVWYFQNQLIVNDGCLSYDYDEIDHEKTKHWAARYNKQIKKLFHIDESVYRGHAKKENGYRLRIQTRKAY
jgi:hypothetical protein